MALKTSAINKKPYFKLMLLLKDLSKTYFVFNKIRVKISTKVNFTM